MLLLLALLLLLLLGRLSLTFQRPAFVLMTGGDFGEHEEESSSSGLAFGFFPDGCNLALNPLWTPASSSSSFSSSSSSASSYGTSRIALPVEE